VNPSRRYQNPCGEGFAAQQTRSFKENIMASFRWMVAAAATLIGMCATVQAASLEEILAADHRSAENRARDVYRHPAETLKFFGVEPGHTVVELWPGGGWYTEILAPYLRDSGKLYAAHFVANSEVEYFQRGLAAFKQKMAANPELYDRVVLTELGPPDALAIAPAGSADVVLTFRNLHNWLHGEADENSVMQAAFTALKPGGVLGIVEHRAAADIARQQMYDSGYMPESVVIQAAEAAGFVLDAKSEINANPRDTRDHPEGVWTLPPRLALGEKDRARYVAIGESDRMTLRFRKPAE